MARKTIEWGRGIGGLALALMLAACGTVAPTVPAPAPAPHSPVESLPAVPVPVPGTPVPVETPAAAPATAPDDTQAEPLITPQHPVWRQADGAPLPAPIVRGKALWQPVRFADLPGWGRDALIDVWNAWLRSCERPSPPWAALCADVRRLPLADSATRYAWVMRHWQPYRVLAADGSVPAGLLTGYYEPELPARRQRDAQHRVPLYAPPPALAAAAGQPWRSRRQIETDPALQAQLGPHVLAWLADPLDALLLHIQGSGRLRLTEPDGRVRLVRLAFAAHNGHPYQSVMRTLLQRGEIREGTWEALRAWAAVYPERVEELLWSNPRVVFFREEPLDELAAQAGPRGAQGVSLTPGRSVAVDREAVPYGTPLWLASSGPVARLQRLVLAQDTGAAIVGAARADLFVGWGQAAYPLAAGLKQPLQLWALWPRAQPLPAID
ncbi:MAG: MltA domain-containing protein [Tepidimonas sp.]|nr:MltA domain-containing protein [Tepidimonas sp.]